MPKIHRLPLPQQLSPDGPPLFAAAGASLPARCRCPARRIRDRFGLSPATAIVAAELAGFLTEGGR